MYEMHEIQKQETEYRGGGGGTKESVMEEELIREAKESMSWTAGSQTQGRPARDRARRREDSFGAGMSRSRSFASLSWFFKDVKAEELEYDNGDEVGEGDQSPAKDHGDVPAIASRQEDTSSRVHRKSSVDRLRAVGLRTIKKFGSRTNLSTHPETESNNKPISGKKSLSSRERMLEVRKERATRPHDSNRLSRHLLGSKKQDEHTHHKDEMFSIRAEVELEDPNNGFMVDSEGIQPKHSSTVNIARGTAAAVDSLQYGQKPRVATVASSPQTGLSRNEDSRFRRSILGLFSSLNKLTRSSNLHSTSLSESQVGRKTRDRSKVGLGKKQSHREFEIGEP